MGPVWVFKNISKSIKMYENGLYSLINPRSNIESAHDRVTMNNILLRGPLYICVFPFLFFAELGCTGGAFGTSADKKTTIQISYQVH